MAELRGGTTIAGYAAIHSGMKDAYLGGNLTVNGQLIPTGGKLPFIGDLSFDGVWNGSNQARGIYWTGFDKESAGDSSDSAHIIHTINSGGLAGSVLEIKSHNDANDGVNFVVNSTDSGVRINGNKIWNASNLPNPLQTSSSYMSLDLTGHTDFPRFVPSNTGTGTGWVRAHSTGTGILPYSNGNSSIGTSSWRFREMHAVNYYENGTALSSKYAAAGHNHDSAYSSASHTHTSINDKGTLTAPTLRNTHGAGLYTYETFGDANTPVTYGNVLSYGQGGGGHSEIVTSWHPSTREMYFRGLRDTTDNWYDWTRVWNSSNFDPNSKANTNGTTYTGRITMSGADINLNNNALIFSELDATNIDHIWHDETNNTFHFVSDAAKKTTGNGTLRAKQAFFDTEVRFPTAVISNYDDFIFKLSASITDIDSQDVYVGDDTRTTAYFHVFGDMHAGGHIGANTMTIYSQDDSSGTLHKGLLIGSSSGLNTVYDSNEVSAFNNGTAATLHLNPDGGMVTMFNTYFRFYIDTADHSVIRIGNSAIKGLGGTLTQVQIRNFGDTAYSVIAASSFVTASRREWKKNITPYTLNALEKVLATQVYEYHYKEEGDNEVKHLGMIYEESPVEIVSVSGDGLIEGARVSLAWKAIQDLHSKMEEQIAALTKRVAELESK